MVVTILVRVSRLALTILSNLIDFILYIIMNRSVVFPHLDGMYFHPSSPLCTTHSHTLSVLYILVYSFIFFFKKASIYMKYPGEIPNGIRGSPLSLALCYLDEYSSQALIDAIFQKIDILLLSLYIDSVFNIIV